MDKTNPSGHPRFIDTDTGKRCRACWLHPDECTCQPDHPLVQIGLLPERQP